MIGKHRPTVGRIRDGEKFQGLARTCLQRSRLASHGSPRKLCEPARVDISGNAAERARPEADAKEQPVHCKATQDGDIEALEIRPRLCFTLSTVAVTDTSS